LRPGYKKARYNKKSKNLFEGVNEIKKNDIRTNFECKKDLENIENIEKGETMVYTDIFDENEIDYEKLEDLINIVFYGLEDKEIIVRWSCAKGIARISERLNSELSNDILENLLNVTKYNQSYEF